MHIISGREEGIVLAASPWYPYISPSHLALAIVAMIVQVSLD